MRYVSYRLFYVEITEVVVPSWYVKKVFLEISQNSYESTGTRDSLLIKLQARPGQACNFIKKESLAQLFFCEFYEISKNTIFYSTLQVAASKTIMFKKIRDSLTNLNVSF